MKDLWQRIPDFWRDAIVRAALTAAQFFLVGISANGALSLDLADYKLAVLSALGAAASVITSAIRCKLAQKKPSYES